MKSYILVTKSYISFSIVHLSSKLYIFASKSYIFVEKSYFLFAIVHFRTHVYLAQNVQSHVHWKINKPTVNHQKEKDLSHVRKMDGAQIQRMIANVKLLVHHQRSNIPILEKVFFWWNKSRFWPFILDFITVQFEFELQSQFDWSLWSSGPSTFIRIDRPVQKPAFIFSCHYVLYIRPSILSVFKFFTNDPPLSPNLVPPITFNFQIFYQVSILVPVFSKMPNAKQSARETPTLEIKIMPDQVF